MSTFKNMHAIARKHPKEQIFYKTLALLGTLYGTADQTWWDYKQPKYRILFDINALCVRICGPAMFSSQVVFLYFHFTELPFHVKGAMFTMVPVNALVILVQISVQQKSFRDIMKKLMEKIHLHNFLEGDKNIHKILDKAEKNTILVSCFVCIILISDAGLWCTLTGYHSLKSRHFIENKTAQLETTLYIMLPIDYTYDFKNWMIVHFLNSYCTLSGAFIIVMHQSVNLLYVFQLIGHIEILSYKIRTNFVGDLSQEEIQRRLIEVVRYHNFVLQLFKDIQAAFGFNVMSYYLYNFIADSLLLYFMMMTVEKSAQITFGLMFLAYVGGLILMSFVLEEIRKQSDFLSDQVYEIKWEDMSVSNRKILLLLLMRTQPSLIFSATGGIQTGVNLMLSILKSTFSYYVMLKSSASMRT